MTPKEVHKKRQDVLIKINSFLEKRNGKEALEAAASDLLKVISETNDIQCKESYKLLMKGNYFLAAAALKNYTSDKTGRPVEL